MAAVDDQAAPALLVLQRGADHAGLAAGQGGHGVEQVGEAGDAVLEGRAGGGIAGVAMPGRDDHARGSQALDHRHAGGLGRQGDQGPPAGQRSEQLEGRLVDLAQL